MVMVEAPSYVVKVSVVGGLEGVVFEDEEGPEEDSRKSDSGRKGLRRSPIVVREASEYEKRND
jgi:hypothetical protein